MKNYINQSDDFGNRLKRIRLEKGLTQVQLGQLASLTNVQVTRYENSITKPTHSSIKKLSNALGILYEELAGEVFEPTFNIEELDAVYEKLKQLPEEDIKVMKKIMDSYVGFKHLTSSFKKVMP